MVSVSSFIMSARVALLAEGVDRNTKDYRTEWTCKGSPSSRRAWIEIITGSFLLS